MLQSSADIVAVANLALAGMGGDEGFPHLIEQLSGEQASIATVLRRSCALAVARELLLGCMPRLAIDDRLGRFSWVALRVGAATVAAPTTRSPDRTYRRGMQLMRPAAIQ